jgi:hypothetical protein
MITPSMVLMSTISSEATKPMAVIPISPAKLLR